MSTVAGCFLIPIGVVFYTIVGGLKATMISDYTHGLVVLIIIFIFAFSAYATHDIIGSPGAVRDALIAASDRNPVEGNKGGSYLTMQSREGAVFFAINLVGNFGTVFLDNG
jgi:urea-proton symporter